MKIFSITLILLFLSACVSAPSGETARLVTRMNFEDSVKLIEEYTSTCWIQEASFSNDRIRTKRKLEGENVVFTIGRKNFDIPFMPFARIIVINSPSSQTEISIEEGSVTLTEPWGVDIKLSRWLQGDKSCK